jgi:hypothetical protein
LILGHKEYGNEYINGIGLWNPYNHDIKIIGDLEYDCFDTNDSIYILWREWNCSNPKGQDVNINTYLIRYKEKSLKQLDQYTSSSISSLSVIMKRLGASHGRERIFRHFFQDHVVHWQNIASDDRTWEALIKTKGLLQGRKGWKNHFIYIKIEQSI